MKGICVGCNYRSTGVICLFYELKRQTECLCVECLVKPICIIQPQCPERSRLLKKLVDEIANSNEPEAYAKYFRRNRSL